jgi:predicted 2-oxoglutarate/Fe(II)-dependent dioxygenase YbiX
VTADPGDAAEGRIAQQLPGIRFFLDYDRTVAELYGAASEAGYLPRWVVLDRELRVIRAFPIDRGEEAIACLAAAIGGAQDVGAPVLSIPRVLEPELCRRLVEIYEQCGGEPSGFMRDIEGKTTLVLDDSFKRRRDCSLDDPQMRQALSARVERFVGPALQRAFQFQATRIERYIVACYAEEGGFFRPHRDNTTLGTAHRRFAVTINLNAEDYEGGDLRFPEFGGRTYRAPTGGAVVFSCSLLHEATPVTSGRRYAFLPFLYDDAGAAVRQANLQHIAPPADSATAAPEPPHDV